MKGAHPLHKSGGGPLGLLKAVLLGLGLPLQLLLAALGLPLHVLEDFGLLLLGLLHQILGHPLGGHQGLAHGLLGGAILLHLVHQHLHLAFQHRVFTVQRGVVRGQNVQKLVHLGHVIPPERRLLKGALGYLLRRKHSFVPSQNSMSNGGPPGAAARCAALARTRFSLPARAGGWP